MPTLDDVHQALEAVVANSRAPVATTSEVAERVDQSRRKTLDDLRLLERAGDVGSKDVGARGLVWWPLDEAAAAPGAQQTRDRHESDTSPQQAEPAGADETGQQAAESESEGDDQDVPPVAEPQRDTEIEVRAAEIVDALEPPQYDRRREEQIAAVEAAYRYLREEGSATMRDFVREVMPDHPVGYDVPELEAGERYRGAWWRKLVKPALGSFPDVEPPSGGYTDWQYVG